MVSQGLDPCLALLRQSDPDRYAATLYLPADKRRDVAAVFAFGAEISTIVDRVSQSMPGEIRLQWWREVILGHRDHGDHPPALALMDVVLRHSLPVEPLMALIDAHVFELYNDPMPDRQALEAWCGETVSALMQLAVMVCADREALDAAEACGHGGVALALTEIVRKTGLDRRKGRCFPPQEILAAAGLEPVSWLSEPTGEKHLNVVAGMCGLAREHRAKALAAIQKTSPQLLPVFLPLATVPAWLSAAEQSRSTLFEQPVLLSPLKRQWLIAKAAIFGLR